MALSFDQITALGNNVILPKVEDNVFNNHPFLKRLMKNAKFKDGGNKIQVPVFSAQGDGSDSEYFDGFDSLDVTPTDRISAALYEWKQLVAKVHISRKEILQNSGPTGIVSILTSKAEFAETEAQRLLTLGLYSDGTAGTGASTTKQLTGLQAALSTTSTYGGIAVADMADWVAQVAGNSGTNRDVTLDLMQRSYQAGKDGSRKPTIITMNSGVFNNVWSLIQPYERLMPGQGSVGFEDADAAFNKTPIIVDLDMESNAIYFINEDRFGLCIHRQENGRKVVHGDLEKQNSQLFKTYWMLNLVTSERRRLAKLDDLTEST